MCPHFDALYAAARRMSMSSTDAEDLVQEVCVKTFLRLDEFEQIKYQYAWLLKVLYHQFIDMQRNRERSAMGKADTGTESMDPDNFSEASEQPDDLVDRENRVGQILKAMAILGKDNCSLVALHDVEGLTLQELHEMTGKPIGTIKAQLHRTRAKLGRLLSNDAISKPHLKVVGGKS
jgi:RNA polymerase sigma-70 factor (ECF subfamily)